MNRADALGEAHIRRVSGQEPDAPFRHDLPLPPEISWYVPAIRMDHRLADGAQVLRLLDGWKVDHPQLAPMIDYAEWVYVTGAGATTVIWERLLLEAREALAAHNERNQAERRLLAEPIAALTRRRDRAAEALAVAQRRFARSAGAAGLACDPEKASPSEVMRALIGTLPDAECVAAELGTHPFPLRESPSERSQRGAWELMAQVVLGAMLGIPFFVTMGYLPPQFASHSGEWTTVVAAAAVGAVILGVLGEAASAAAATAFRAAAKLGTPARRSLVVPAAMLSAVALLGFGEAASQGFGAYLVNAERLADLGHLGGEGSPVSGVTLLLCLGAGCLSTGAFLSYKLVRSWRSCQADADRCRVKTRLHQIKEELRMAPTWRKALRRSYEVARLRREHELLNADLKRLEARDAELAPRTELDAASRSRLDAAHDAAVGETGRWQSLVLQIVRRMGADSSVGTTPEEDRIRLAGWPSVTLVVLAALFGTVAVSMSFWMNRTVGLWTLALVLAATAAAWVVSGRSRRANAPDPSRSPRRRLPERSRRS